MPTKYSIVGDKLFAYETADNGTVRSVHNHRLIAVIPKSLIVDEGEFKDMIERANDCDGLRDYFRNAEQDKHERAKKEGAVYGIENADTHSPSIVNIVFS